MTRTFRFTLRTDDHGPWSQIGHLQIPVFNALESRKYEFLQLMKACPTCLIFDLLAVRSPISKPCSRVRGSDGTRDWLSIKAIVKIDHVSTVNAGLYSIFPSKLNQSFMTSQGIPEKPTFLDLRTRPLPSFCAPQSPIGPKETQSTSRRSQQTYPSTVKREDAQPNEGTWVPYRLRRPAQPPSIRPISSISANQQVFHHPNAQRPIPSSSRYHEPGRTQGPSHLGSYLPRQSGSQMTRGDWRNDCQNSAYLPRVNPSSINQHHGLPDRRCDRQNSVHLPRVNPSSNNQYHGLPLRLDCPTPSSSVAPTPSLSSQPREVQPSTRRALTTLKNGSEATSFTPHQPCQSPPAIQSRTTSPSTSRRNPTWDDADNSVCRKRPFLGNTSSSSQQPSADQAGATPRPETIPETGSLTKKPRYSLPRFGHQPVPNTDDSGAFPMVIVRATLRPGLSMDKCLILTRSLLAVKSIRNYSIKGNKVTEFTGKVEFANPEDAYKASQVKLIAIPNHMSYKGLQMSVKLYKFHDEEESSTQDLAGLSPAIVDETPPEKEGLNASTGLDIIETDQVDHLSSPGTPPPISSPGTPPRISPGTPPQASLPGTPPIPQKDAQFISSSTGASPSSAECREDSVREPSEGDNASRQLSISGDSDMEVENSSDIEIVNPEDHGDDDHETASLAEHEDLDSANEDIKPVIIGDTTPEVDRQDSLCHSQDSTSAPPEEHRSSPMDQIDEIIRDAEREVASANLPANQTVDSLVVAQEDVERTSRSASSPSSLPLHEVAFAYPRKCERNAPDHANSRHLFELEKVRAMTQENKRVMTSSWVNGYLILRVVDTRSPDGSESSQDVDQLSDRPVSPRQQKLTPQKPTAAVSIPSSTEASLSGHSRNSTSVSVDLSEDRHVVSRDTQQQKWPFVPKATYLDERVHPDLRKSLYDFLSTFFRLWEESRVDLRHLYDKSAIFSNLLAKQGCTPTRVTKNIGWSSIYHSISRLPALSNEPLDNLIVDAWPVPTDPKTLLCLVHGAFAEFPKNIQRAFDRSFVLRPVDTNRDPSEGCLGLIKWIILSDTLTIRKHTDQTNAIITSFKAQCTLNADRLRSISRRRTKGSQACSISENCNHRSSQVSSVDDTPRPQKSSDKAPQSPRAASPPALLGNTPSPHDVAVVSAPLIADLKAQLRELRSELDQLKNKKREEANMRPFAPARPQQRSNPPFRPLPNDGFRVRNSFAYTHRGFGVTKKRYLVPTDMNVHLNVSLRGDVLSWDRRDRSKVQLLTSGPSATDIVDAACYSATHKTLILGSRTSNTSRVSTSSQVSLIKFHRPTKNGKLLCHRNLLPQVMHEQGVRATCLLPPDHHSLGFVTSGIEKQIMLWNSFNGKVEITKRYTDHKSAIQALDVSAVNQLIFSGDSGGRVYQTNIESNTRFLLLEARSPIHWIQTDPMNQYTVVVTTGNKTPDYQFRLCDIRGNRPAINFGFGEDPNFKGFESPVETFRKGGIRDNYFVYPDGQVGGLKIWDLRSTRGHLMKVGTSVGIHALFESRKTVVLLEKETLRYIEFQ
ncbi:hypothetical protein DFH28DRAFT_1130033 [Melampsora americana]|nr:hypothetical protein DFH28DRAFT_1130033 [Melampsora americana]